MNDDALDYAPGLGDRRMRLINPLVEMCGNPACPACQGRMAKTSRQYLAAIRENAWRDIDWFTEADIERKRHDARDGLHGDAAS